MNAVFSPIVSEFETEQQEADYMAWLHAKVQASLNDRRPNIPHDRVMAEARRLLESKTKNRAFV